MNDQEPLNRPEEAPESVDETQPKPMKSKPILQSMGWVAGVAAGGLLAFLFVVENTHTHGATKASRAAWRMRQLGPASVALQDAEPQNEIAGPSLLVNADDASAPRGLNDEKVSHEQQSGRP